MELLISPVSELVDSEGEEVAVLGVLLSDGLEVSLEDLLAGLEFLNGGVGLGVLGDEAHESLLLTRQGGV